MGFGDLTIWDWREIRTGDYWEIRDSLSSVSFSNMPSQRDLFILERIELWRRNKLNKT